MSLRPMHHPFHFPGEETKRGKAKGLTCGTQLQVAELDRAPGLSPDLGKDIAVEQQNFGFQLWGVCVNTSEPQFLPVKWEPTVPASERCRESICHRAGI